jgi:DNA repair protein RadC
MAAPKHQRVGDRCDRASGVHMDRGTLPRSLAAIARGMAAGRSDDPRRQQLCPSSAAEGIWDRPGNLGLSTVCDNICRYPARTPEAEVNLLKTVLGPSVSDSRIRALLCRFGSTASLYSAEPEEIADILGSAHEAAKLQSILQVAAEIGKSSHINHPAIGSCEDLVRYLQNAMGSSRVETFRVLFLDTHNRIIADELLWSGTVSEVQVYPREVIRRALELDSSAFIAAHNHPSDVVVPSRADIDMTCKLLKGAAALGIAFHDHFIVSANHYHSMRFHKSVDPWG